MGKYCQFCRHKTFWGGCYEHTCEGGNKFEPSVTPERFSETMIAIKNTYGGDPEVAHSKMDDYLCDTLEMMGYEHGVKVFQDTDKWYA